MDTATARKSALDFLKSHKTGVLSTASLEGQPHASAVYYMCDDDFNIYFVTLITSRKFAAIKANPKVAFVVGRQDVPQTVQLEGTAEEITYNEEKSQRVADLVEILTSNSAYYPPIAQLDRSEIVVVWVKPLWLRWADYAAFKSGTSEVCTEIPLQ
ncbi:pyridoxamine 5'-phosphate oxidase family protein [Candidatus Kaiserbacteria bacterium]|nr:pyridoxamine 5'-phosphate oxidase family protein [Candidatus Kaiserbacteria bacterium]